MRYVVRFRGEVYVVTGKWFFAFLSVLVAEATGILSSFLSGDVKSTYAGFVKPPFSPPDWMFGIVWPIMYALMGFAAYLVFRHQGDVNKRQNALLAYGFQLFLNFTWSIVFFRLSSVWGGLINIVALDVLVIFTIALFRRIDKTAANLMMPYLLWILYATYLNAGIAFLN